jgi:hypothetical protein
MSIFGRLGYDSANTANVVTPLSANVAYTMNSMPSLLNTWQTEDVSSNTVGGYFQNPVGSVTQNIWSIANNIVIITGAYSVANLSNVMSSANSLVASCNSFYSHTNRISGVSGMDLDQPTLPTYNSVIGVSKIVMLIVTKSDNIQNNAPMMGNFTSLTIANSLNASYNTIIAYANTIANSISSSSDGGEPPTTTYSSNLTSNQISTIANNINVIVNLMNNRRNGDVNFYYNSQNIVSNYNQLKQFSSPGQTELYILNNYIGTDKLKTRINS